MECEEIIFSSHAIQRMFERGIRPSDLRIVITSGEKIGDYPDDTPYPSCLMLGVVNDRPIHAVIAVEPNTRRCYVVIAYIPDPTLWDADFRTSRN